MTDEAPPVLGDWTIVTFRNAATNRVLLVQGQRDEPPSTRDAIDESLSWAVRRSSPRPVGSEDLLFAGDLGPFVEAYESGRVEAAIVAGYGRDEALEEVVKVAKRHKAAGRWPEPIPRAAPASRRRSASTSTRARSATRATNRPSTPRAPRAPKPPPPPEPKPCPSCFMYPTSRAVQDGECDQCGAPLA